MGELHDVGTLREQLRLTEAALQHERRHSAFLLGLLLGRDMPQVRPDRPLRQRCSDALAELLAGPGRG